MGELLATTVSTHRAESFVGEQPAVGTQLIALLGKLETPTDGVDDYSPLARPSPFEVRLAVAAFLPLHGRRVVVFCFAVAVAREPGLAGPLGLRAVHGIFLVAFRVPVRLDSGAVDFEPSRCAMCPRLARSGPVFRQPLD